MIEKIAIRITSILFLINLFCGFVILIINTFSLIFYSTRIIDIKEMYIILSLILSVPASLIIITMSGFLDIMFNLRETKHEKSNKSK
jgi:uncharacterized protein YybS (DUF2232 family)